VTKSRSSSPLRDLPKVVLARWYRNRQKWALLCATALLCLPSFILVASLPVSAYVQQRNVLHVVIRQKGINTVVPTPTLVPTATPTPTPAPTRTPTPFVAQPSPEPIASLPTTWSQQVNVLQANYRLFYHGNVNLPEVALTFDDGPNPPYTSQILDVLRSYNVKASFFDVGYLVRKYPDLVRQEMAEGHVVGNHTWDHAHLPPLSTSDITREINDTSDELQKVTGTRPTFFRPPYGETDAHTLTIINNLGLTTFMWNVDPADWSRPAPNVVSSKVTNVARNGVIILLHDGGGDRTNTVTALSTIIQKLQARGFRFVTLSQLVDDAKS
jgi:peptidoglycan/xylan/chitin deacetylase (PgdA/CDA1 family)